MAQLNFRQWLMLFSACGLAMRANAALADNAPQVNLGVQLAQLGQPAPASPTSTIEPRSGTPGKAIPPSVSAGTAESIVVRGQRRLLKEKNSPSAVTELGASQIQATGVSGSPGTLLRQAPSIYVYQQGIGDNAPELTVRGLRGLEVASTLDGVPTQDLLAPGASYLANNLGGVFTLNQISGVSIYPGVAYPDKNTFGTIGGTIAYASKRPTNDYYFDVTGSVGSFGTYTEGFEFNSGAIDSPLGTGDNAARVLLNYRNLQTQGFIDGTPNRENEMEFAFDKPYDDGLSAFQTTVIYNTANGLIENEPVPTDYLNLNGRFSNYPTNLDFAQQKNDFLSIILKDDTYVNDYVSAGLTVFYIGNDNQTETYSDPGLALPGGVPGRLTVNGTSPFINNPAGFGEGGLYGPAGGGDPLGIFGSGYGGYFYGTGHHYNPLALYPAGSRECPNSLVDAYGGAGFAPCGINDQISQSHSDTYGIQPRLTIIPPEYFGIANTIKIGGLFAKETEPAGYGYLGGDPQTPQDALHAIGNGVGQATDGGTQRTIYQGYIQDKIDFLDNTLHITPGATLEGTFSSVRGSDVFLSLASPYYGATGAGGPNGVLSGLGTADQTNIDQYGPYKATKWDREFLPFFNISYDLDKILPAAKGVTIYGSVGNSALFAPVGDFGPNTAGPPPYASTVHLYEGGIKYNTPVLALSLDYFYQKVDRDFGYFSSQTGTSFGQTVYSGVGQREFKGFEASGIYQILPSLQLFGNVSHLLAKYLTTGLDFDTVAEDQYGVSIKGTPISGIPDWLSTFGADFTHSNLLVDEDKIDVRLTGQYTGHQYTTCDLTLLDPGCGSVYIPGVKGVDYSGGLHSDNVYDTFTGDTTTDRHGGGISPFAVFNLDVNYKLPTPGLAVVKNITFDLNIQNLFDERFFQYYYKQVSPVSCSKSATDPTGNPYGCTPQFADAIPGQPFSVFFTVTARF